MPFAGDPAPLRARQMWLVSCVLPAVLALLAVAPARAQQPDLVPTIESGTSITSPGTGVQAVVSVQNVGSAATQTAFWVRLFVGFGRTACTTDLGTVDEELIAIPVPAGGQVTGLSMLGGLPAGVDSPGIYRLCVEADSRGFVTESDETNNETSSTLQVLECLFDAECDDFVPCTVETCTNNLCSSAPVVCDDGNACTTDQCSITTGLCVFSLLSCNDGDVCTTDTCDPALGCQTDPLDCDDGDPCTADGCGSTVGCFHTPIECPVAVPVESSTGLLALAGLILGLGVLGARRAARVA